MTETRRDFRLTGRVQGVGFRWWTRQTAGELGLRGTVRNDPDGSVEIRAAGRPEALEDFERRLHEGPGAARVESVQTVEPEGDDDLPSGFEIVR